MPKTTSLTSFQKLAISKGFSLAPRDHPIYSEGSSITFLRHTPSRSQGRATASHQTGSRKEKDWRPKAALAGIERG